MNRLLEFLKGLLLKPQPTPDPRPEILEIAYSLRQEPYAWRQKGDILVRYLNPEVTVGYGGVLIAGKLVSLSTGEYREITAALQHWTATRPSPKSLQELRDEEWRAAHTHLPKLRTAKR